MTSDLNQEMLSAAESAVKHAREHWSTTLDYSARSVEDVELILARMYESIPKSRVARLFRKPPSDEQMASVAVIYGAYLGEVLRREFGGTWSREELDGQPDLLALKFTDKNMLFPAGKIWKRLTNGDEDNVWTFYQSMRQQLSR